MANVNDANFINRKLDEGNKRDFPNLMGCFNTTGKKITAAFMMFSATMLVITAFTNLLPELPRPERPRFSEGDRENSTRGNK